MRKRVIKTIVIASMKIALWRMKTRLFLHTTRRSMRNVFQKTVKKLTKINDNQKKNTVKLANMEVEEI
jgi:hypothetical protein